MLFDAMSSRFQLCVEVSCSPIYFFKPNGRGPGIMRQCVACKNQVGTTMIKKRGETSAFFFLENQVLVQPRIYSFFFVYIDFYH